MAHKRVTLSIATIKRLEIEVGPVNNVIRVEVITPCNDKHFIAMHVVQCLIKNPFSFALLLKVKVVPYQIEDGVSDARWRFLGAEFCRLPVRQGSPSVPGL
jgi:hypothetical protein